MKNYNGMSDEALAMRYVEGDNRAFDELLARNQQKLYNYIMFVVRDPELANDVFQDTFVKVITRLQEGKYTDSGKFSFWLTRIAHNIIMDCYRQHKCEHIEPRKRVCQLASSRRRALHDGCPSCCTARSGVHAVLSGPLVQGDFRVYRCKH